MFAINQIAERLRTQDNLATADPIFLVEQERKIYGVDPEYTDLTERAGEDDPRMVGYVIIHEYVTACFTRAAAELYIDENRHNLSNPRVFAASGYRNKEWIAVRKYIAEQSQTRAPR